MCTTYGTRVQSKLDGRSIDYTKGVQRVSMNNNVVVAGIIIASLEALYTTCIHECFIVSANIAE